MIFIKQQEQWVAQSEHHVFAAIINRCPITTRASQALPALKVCVLDSLGAHSCRRRKKEVEKSEQQAFKREFPRLPLLQEFLGFMNIYNF